MDRFLVTVEVKNAVVNNSKQKKNTMVGSLILGYIEAHNSEEAITKFNESSTMQMYKQNYEITKGDLRTVRLYNYDIKRAAARLVVDLLKDIGASDAEELIDMYVRFHDFSFDSSESMFENVENYCRDKVISFLAKAPEAKSYIKDLENVLKNVRFDDATLGWWKVSYAPEGANATANAFSDFARYGTNATLEKYAVQILETYIDELAKSFLENKKVTYLQTREEDIEQFKKRKQSMLKDNTVSSHQIMDFLEKQWYEFLHDWQEWVTMDYEFEGFEKQQKELIKYNSLFKEPPVNVYEI